MGSICFRPGWERAFGTWPLQGADLRRALEAALEAGYRAIDTAQMYGNEAAVGETLAGCGVPRGALMVTTKVHPDNYAPERFLPSVEASLKALRVEAVDLLLLHWPPIGGDVAPPLRLLAEAQARGLARHVGISNFNSAMMRVARDLLPEGAATNQVEFHPLIDQSRLLAAAAETGIPLSAYCSVARGQVFGFPLFAEIAAGYRVTAGQVVLRWILQKGVSVNTMSTRPENLRANFDVMGFTLSSIDMGRIDALAVATNRRIVTSAIVPWAPDWD